MDIVLEYIRHHDATKTFTEEQERELAGKVKVIYDEFSDFRNVRSMLNILYHATENAAKRDIATIDEQAIDDTIKNVYPGLRIRGSVMDVPISDFIKIRRNCNDFSMLESGVRSAVKDLVNYAHEVGVVARPHSTDAKGNGIDVMFSDPYGTKVAVVVVINKDHAKSFEQISNTLKSTGFVDKLVILTNANTTAGTNGSTLVNIDRCKMIDLIYFSNKYKNNDMQQDDSQRAILLAKSIRLC
jgi:F420-0:gamma-glutamyl ligase